MKTIVCQSYRTNDVPKWIARCLRSTEEWAKDQGFDYEFWDDRFFNFIPADLFNKINRHKGAGSNLARLELIKQYLTNYERAIWIDADVIIFDPESFTIDKAEHFAFCREIWVSTKRKRFRTKIICDEKVNNAVTVFTRNTKFLDYYIEACQQIIMKNFARFQRWDIGTTFLTTLHSIVPFTLLTNVGLLSPIVLKAILQADESVIKTYITSFGYPIAAANLCASFQDHDFEGYVPDEEAFNRVIDKLLTTRGRIVNCYLDVY